jgi:hypothetical protein
VSRKFERPLFADGYPTDDVIEIWRAGYSEWAVQGRLGAVNAGHRYPLALRQERLSGSRYGGR